MADKEFLKLIKLREQWIKSTRANGFDFSPLLAGQYNDPSHFIYEILQNAEDANAKKISFQVFDDRLEVIHNGKDFDYNDVDGITGIGISTKKDDLNKIGKFGVGFKSVFAVTETPRIHSGQYDFEIRDFVVPKPLKKIQSKNNQTKITLPFNHRKRSKEEVYSIIEKKLENIELTTLLFLSNIEVIEWHSKSKNEKYFKKTIKLSDFENVKDVEIHSENEGVEYIEKYIVIYRNIKIDENKLKVEIAFKLGKNKEDIETIIPIKDSKLVVFFPTEKITFLNFLIQGPFKTTPNRENIPLEDEQNCQLIDEISELAANSLAIIKKINLLNVDFLEILPISGYHPNEIIYNNIFKRIRKEFLTGETLLPTSTSGFSKPEDALLARGKELITFLNKTDINFIFGKKNWLNSEITQDRTRDLRDYLLTELNIKEIDFSIFAEKISEDFMKRKKDSWIIDFYRKLLDRKNLWDENYRNAGNIRKKPIIRLKNGTHIAPFDQNGKIQVYLPTENTSKYKTVKDTLLKNKKSLDFLKQLGLSKPDPYSEIKEFIFPKYLDDSKSVNKGYYEDFKKILVAYEKIQDDKKNELVKDIKELSLISCSQINSNKIFLRKPSEVYLPSTNLIEYFNGFPEAYFVDKNLEEKILDFYDKSEFDYFLIKIGCNDCPKRVPFDANLSYEEQYDLRNNAKHTWNKSATDYDYEGIDNFLKTLSLERSLLLWNFLLKSIKNEQLENDSNFFKGIYIWVYRNYDNYAYFESKFLRVLKHVSWLYDGNNIAKIPKELSPLELNDLFPKDSRDSEHLIEILGLIPDPIKLFEEKWGGKFIPNDEYEEYQLFKAEKARTEEKEIGEETGSEWTPEVMPDSLKPKVFDIIDLQPLKPKDLEYRKDDLKNTILSQGESDDENNGKTNEPKNPKKLKQIGRWGETHVLEALKDRFDDAKELIETELGFTALFDDGYVFEVKWLNKSSDFGIGYDFVIKRNDLEVEYIEVKSKVSDQDELIEITGTQWEFARKLYSEGNGNNYYIYVVQNAGSPNASIKKINNPISLWYSGKLYAHPVCFKL